MHPPRQPRNGNLPPSGPQGRGQSPRGQQQQQQVGGQDSDLGRTSTREQKPKSQVMTDANPNGNIETDYIDGQDTVAMQSSDEACPPRTASLPLPPPRGAASKFSRNPVRFL